MKKHIIKTSVISAIIYIILCTLMVFIINFFIVSFMSRALDASILDKYFTGDKFESIFITENPSAAKAISFLMQDYKTDFNPDETNNDKSTGHSSKLISTTILYDNNGNILREGQIAPAFKYSEDKDLTPKERRTLFKNDIYGQIPIEYVFTKEQFEHALEIAKNTPNLDVKINSYYRVGNRFFPISVSYYDGDTLIEEMNFEGNYEITDDMVYHEADGMLMALNMNNQQELISYKDSDVLELRDELKDYVNQKGFNEDFMVTSDNRITNKTIYHET